MSETEPIPPGGPRPVTALRNLIIGRKDENDLWVHEECEQCLQPKSSLAANARRNNEKALNILLSAIPDRHHLIFHDAVNARIDDLAIRNKVLIKIKQNLVNQAIDRNKFKYEDWVDMMMKRLMYPQQEGDHFYSISAALTRDGLIRSEYHRHYIAKHLMEFIIQGWIIRRPRISMLPHHHQKVNYVGSQSILPQTVQKSAMINPKQTWRPKGNYLDSVNRDNGSYTLKQFEANPKEEAQGLCYHWTEML
ncbi:hypothetical protein Tco_1184337 [Tanacetum coccineum]